MRDELGCSDDAAGRAVTSRGTLSALRLLRRAVDYLLSAAERWVNQPRKR